MIFGNAAIPAWVEQLTHWGTAMGRKRTPFSGIAAQPLEKGKISKIKHWAKLSLPLEEPYVCGIAEGGKEKKLGRLGLLSVATSC